LSKKWRKTMKKMIKKQIVALVVLTAALLALGASTTYAQEVSVNAAEAAGPCSLHNVAGTYGYTGSGTVVVANPIAPPPIPVNEAGTFVLNADGTFTITKVFQNVNGVIMNTSPVTGTYTVSSDCTTTATNQFGSSFFGVFVDERKEIRYMLIGGAIGPGRAGAVISYVAKRI
jgi:hypothetical protein